MAIGKYLDAYHRLLHKHPISTQIITTSIIMGMGDAISQMLVEHKKRFKVKRTAKICLLGAAVVVSIKDTFF